MPDKLFIKLELDLPADVFERSDWISAAKKVKVSLESLIEENLPGAVMTFGVDAERIPDVVKGKGGRPKKTQDASPDAPAAAAPEAAPMPEPAAEQPQPETPQAEPEAPPARHGRRAAA